MNFDRTRQRLLLDGREYAPADLDSLPGQGQQELYDFLREWFDGSPYVSVQTSGSTGTPKVWQARKTQMMQSARLTCEALGLRVGDTALLNMNLRYIGAKMMVVRSLVAGLNLLVRPASGHPLADVETTVQFASMVPMQVYNTLQVAAEKERLGRADVLIIGGGAVDEALLTEVGRLPGKVYSTYGMTETLSHIALRRLNGPEASERYFPLPSVHLSLSERGTLTIEAPLVCDEVLHTNDVARLFPDGSFIVLGRIDNVINSGGIKIQAEELEAQLRQLLPGLSLVVTSMPDARLGEAVVLLVEKDLLDGDEREAMEAKIRAGVSSYSFPKRILTVERIPLAGNGKVDRAACKKLVLL
ncbi:MAG: AMP-binding protein [Mediterranea sp.]|jgi:O-succinylbenzoic acid--CoA ligase|nr:AMP-binding protein [Mediterranea sp.]